MAFRQAALTQGISVAAYLGRLVDREVRRRRSSEVGRRVGRDAGAGSSAGGACEVGASIDELDRIAGRLARSATAHGGSWSDVATSLRLSPEQARRAYETPS
jgi:hypothetical protein